MKIGIVVTALLFLAACEPPSADLFKNAARGYFADLNATASETRHDVETTGAGLVRHFYNFDPDASVLLGMTCTKCGEDNDFVDYDGKKPAKCGKCGEVVVPDGLKPADLQSKYPQKAFPMFKITQDAKPMKAEVRYVRRVYYWDSRGRIDLPAQKMGELIASTTSVHDFADGVNSPGLHRHLTTYQGKIELELRGARAVAISSVQEKPIRDWLFALQPYKPLK